MARSTRAAHRNRGKFPPRYARSLALGEMPKGSAARGAGLEPWQYPLPDLMRGVIVCGQIKQRLCRQMGGPRPVAS